MRVPPSVAAGVVPQGDRHGAAARRDFPRLSSTWTVRPNVPPAATLVGGSVSIASWLGDLVTGEGGDQEVGDRRPQPRGEVVSRARRGRRCCR